MAAGAPLLPSLPSLSMHTSCINVFFGRSRYHGPYLSVLSHGGALSTYRWVGPAGAFSAVSMLARGTLPLSLPSPPSLSSLSVHVLVVSATRISLFPFHTIIFSHLPIVRSGRRLDSYTESVTVLPVPNERAAAIRGSCSVREIGRAHV